MRTLAMTVAAGMIVAAAQAQNYQQQNQNRNRSHQDRSSYQQFDQRDQQTRSSRGQQSQVKKFNKASNLIGTEVQLRDGQKAGKVKDVVIDFEVGQVGYIVVDAKAVLQDTQNGTLIAVPAGAFKLQNEKVVLNANRSKLQRQRTFKSENFPALQRGQVQRMSESWGAGSVGSDQFGQSQYGNQQQRQYGTQQRTGQDYSSDYSIADGSSEQLYLYFYDPQQAQGRSGSVYGGYGESEYGQSRQNQNEQRQQSQNRRQQQQQQSRDYGFQGTEPQWHEEIREEFNEQTTQGQRSPYQSRQQQSQRRGQGSTGQNQSGQYEYDNYTYDYEFDSQQNQGQARVSSEKTRTMSGTITNIDRNNNSITVENWAGHEWNFRLPQSQQGNRTRLSQFQEGQEVQVDFAYENGDWRAFNIQRQQN